MLETVMVVAVSSAVFIALSILILNLYKTSDYYQAVLESSGSAGKFLKEVEFFTLPASAVLQSHAFSDATRTSSSTVLVLELPSIDASGNIISGAHDYAAFYATGTEAYRRLETHASSARTPGTKQLSSTLHALTFSYDNIDFAQVTTVTVDAHMQTLVKSATISDHRQQKIRLRNH